MLENFSVSDFSDEGFEEIFIKFDKDGSGTIDKDEMFIFMQQLLGLEINKQIQKTQNKIDYWTKIQSQR